MDFWNTNMENYRMEKIKENEIVIYQDSMPHVLQCGFCNAQEPFLHIDRCASFHVMIYVVKGTIYVSEEAKTVTDYAVHEGELLLLKSGCHHYGKELILKGTQWYYMHFQIPQISEYQYKEMQYTVLPKTLQKLQDTELEKQIREYIEMYHLKRPFQEWQNRICAAQFFLEMISKKEFSKRTISLSDRIETYLYHHAKEPFRAQLLEDSFFLSYKHLAAVFKKEKQCTMQQFHTKARMEAACNLLQLTNLTIGEISEELGFEDLLYFSRVFHKYMGVSPTKYRKTQNLLY